MILRPYQIRQRNSVLGEWNQGVTSTLVVSPTGSGKSVTIAAIIEACQPKRAMVVAHRSELIYQNRDKITRHSGIECGIEMADAYVNGSLFGDLPVIVSTIQTQSSAHGDRKRMSRFSPKDFGLLIIDEAHRSLSKSYLDLINYYKTNNPAIKICGFTATPDLASEEAMGQVYETCPPDQQYEILDAIHEGWLCDVDQQFVTIGGLDFSQMRTTAGDLNGADLAEVMESEKNLQGVAAATLDIVGSRRTLIFTASVKQAEVLSSIFNRHKAGCSAWVCGATNKDDRRSLLNQYDAGKIQIMVNCNCLSEGYDSPGVEVVVQARPTKSRCLYAQQVGRCLRPLPGVVDGPETPELRKLAIAQSKKPRATVIDFVGNSGKHKLVSSADILGGKVSDAAIESAIAKAKKDGGAVRIADLLDEEEEKIRKAAEERRRLEEARKAKIVAKAKFSTRSVNPFDLFQLAPVKERGWDNGKVLSEKQKALLMKQGINPSEMPYAQAKQVLNEMFRRWNAKLASVKQLAVLRRYGYTDANMPLDTAKHILDRLSKNGWRKEAVQPVQTETQPEEEVSPF